MINYIYEITSGLLASFVAIYGLNYFYEILPYLRKELGSYRNRIMFTPIYFIIITIFVAKILDLIVDKDAKIRNYFPYIKGFFIGFILSFIGGQYWHIDRLLRLDNPFMLHVYIPILYMIIYGLIIQYIFDNICPT